MCLSVTSWCSTKIAKRGITGSRKQYRTIPRGCSFLTPKTSAKFEQGHPKGGAYCRWGRLKSANFVRQLDIIAQDRRIVSVKSNAIYQMVMLPMTLGDPWQPKITPISTFCVAFRIYVVGERRDFKFGVQVDHGKSQPTDDKPSLKGRGHVT